MIAWFDIFSGISGDMTIGAFIDLGVPIEWLRKSLALLSLSIGNGNKAELCPQIRYENIMRNGIKAVDFFVDIAGAKNDISVHKGSYVHGEKYLHTGSSLHQNTHARSYKNIKNIIAQSKLSPRVKSLSLSAFEKIARAESEIHGLDIDEVHFHEVGAIDSIVDIVGSFLCVEFLGIKEIYASEIPLGKGFVECSHGTLPVPAPAVMAILKGIPVKDSSIEMEIVTPTGAAIIATLASGFGPMPDMVIEKTGYGSGKNTNHSDIPNLLRIITGTRYHGGHLPLKKETIINHGFINDKTKPIYENQIGDESIIVEDIFVIETSIDDMIPEISGYLMEKLFEKGALDVCNISVQMKKNRPGTRLEVLCRSDKLKDIIKLILDETTTTGIRYNKVKRAFLKRKKVFIDTYFGKIQAKQITGAKGEKRVVPEYEACHDIAVKNNIPLRDIYTQVYLDINRTKIIKSH